MNEIEKYNTLKKITKKTKIKGFFDGVIDFLVPLMFVQSLCLLIDLIWFNIWGAERLAEYGYVFQDILWTLSSDDHVLSPVLIINVLVFLFCSPFINIYSKIKFSSLECELDGDGLHIITILYFLIFVIIANLCLSHAPFIIATSITLSIVIISYFFSKLQKLPSGTTLGKLEYEINKSYINILKSENALTYLKDNKKENQKLYKEVRDITVESNKDKLFEIYCNQENQKINEEKKYNEEIAFIENT